MVDQILYSNPTKVSGKEMGETSKSKVIQYKKIPEIKPAASTVGPAGLNTYVRVAS